MKQLLLCISLLAPCQLSLGATVSQSKTVSHADIEFYRTIIPNLSPASTHKDIKRALKVLLRTYHPDKNSSKEAKKKYDSIIAALEKISGAKTSKSSNAKNQANIDEIAAFEDECGRCVQNIHQNLHVYFSNTLEHLQSDVAGGSLPLEEAKKGLITIKQEIAQIADFIATCESLQKNPYCSEQDRSRLENIATNVHGPVAVQVQEELAEIQRNIAVSRGLGDQEIDTFINSCRQILQSPWCSPINKSILLGVLARVETRRQIEDDDRVIYQQVKSDLSACCVKLCYELINDSERSPANVEFLKTLIAKAQAGQEISSHEQQRYKEIDLLGRARVDHLLWLCKEYIAVPTNLPSRSIFLNQWLKDVQEKNWVSLEEEKALEAAGKDVIDMFIVSCKQLLADPLCHATGYEEVLRKAMKNMKNVTVVSAQYRELYNQVKAKLAELRQQQSNRFNNSQTPKPNSEQPRSEVPAPVNSASVHAATSNYWHKFKPEFPSGLYRSWGTCKEGGKWFLSFIAPLALAMGHGLLNNFLAHKTGNLEQGAFFEGPWHELPIGLSALAMHAFLGRNLYQKLHDRLYGHSYQRHDVEAATFAVLYLLTSGALQNVGERLPMCGTGWRLLMFGRSQTLADAMFSNVSLFAGMQGLLLGGVMALCRIPYWLGH